MHTHKILVLMLTISCRALLNAQNEYFENNPIWGMTFPCQWAPFDPEWGRKVTLFIAGDTLLNDEVYVKIYEEGFTFSGTGTASYTETPYTNPLPVAFLRSEEMKMFKWNELLNVKELLYDFDVSIGEVFNLSPNLYNILFPLTVQAIDYILLGGIERKIITATQIGEQSNFTTQYIEGVGHWRGIWHPNGAQLDCQNYLTCYSLNGIPYFVNTEFSPWLVPSMEVCEFVVGVDEIASPLFKIYPNPASDQLNIRSDLSIRQIEIFELSGRMVLKKRTIGNVVNIDTTSLSTGFYFLSVTTENGIISTTKILKN